MTTSSTPDNLIGWTNSDPENMPLAVTTLRDSIQTALSKRQISSFRVANAVGLAAITGMVEGDIADRADIDITYRYNGIKWMPVSSGLVPVVPLSVGGTGVTMATNGKITFTGASIAQINNCFNADFDSYQIIIDTSAATSDIFARLRLAGNDIVTTIYSNQRFVGSATSTVVDQAFNATSWRINSGGQPFNAIVLNIINPSLSINTQAISTFVDSGSSMTTGNIGLFTNSTTNANGISIFPATGTFTGTIRIYGYNNNA